METNSGQTENRVDIEKIERGVLVDLEATLSTWNSMAKWLQTLLVLLGIVAVTTSLYVSSFAGSDEYLSPTWLRILSFITTLSLTMITTFSLSAKANNARNAWRLLNRALYSYKSNIIDADELIKAYDEGEKILGDVSFNFTASKTSKTGS